MIHPTAIIHPKAQVHPTCEIGPYAVIDGHVTLGEGCVVGPHVYLTGVTTIGGGNRFHAGAVIGDAPQDLKYKDEPTGVRIGDNNVFREHVTLHRSAKLGEETVIGSHCLLMANSHIGHNSRMGDHVIVANGALFGGHVTVGDRVFISGNCLLHQFVRVGTMALMQGGSGISKDLPPYTIARGGNHVCGLNVVGMRRAGVSAGDRLELKKLYHALFLSGENLRHAAATARERFKSPIAQAFLEFVQSSRRGICTHYGRSGQGTSAAEES